MTWLYRFTTVLLVLAPWGLAEAASPPAPVKIGVLTDISGYTSAISGRGSILAATMAVEDFGPTINGRKIEIVSADHQNKPDVGSAIARQWYNVDGVDVIVDIPNSAVSLAVQEVARNANRVVIHSAAATSLLTGKSCSPNGVHFGRDTYATSRSIGEAVVQSGGDTWFFITADYAFGHALEQDVGRVVAENGGTVVGQVHHPMNVGDFAPFLLQAQNSRAKVIALADVGEDTINAIKQASEFGIAAGGQRLVAMSLFISDVHSLGLRMAQGLQLVDQFYWDRNDETRAWSKRFFERQGSMPTAIQADAYNAVSHFLKAAAISDPEDGVAVVRTMKSLPVNTPLIKNAVIREDGRLVRDIYLLQVKSPGESTGPWDYEKIERTVPGDQVVRPLSQSECLLVKQL